MGIRKRKHASNMMNAPVDVDGVTSIIMSAPNNAGRQSPEPEKQSDAQTGPTTTGNVVNDQGAGPKQGAAKASDDAKSGLSSNPEHPLAKHAEQTTSKK
ncbi:hypothetical protein ACEQ8H_001438 [Pleosporales sp. CAS-2024a]